MRLPVTPRNTPVPVLLSLATFLTLAVSAPAQSAAPPAPGAPLAAAAMTALTGGVPLTSVRITGHADWTAGSTVDSGTIVLEASGPSFSRVDLELTEGSSVSVRAPIGSGPDAPSGGGSEVTGALAGPTSPAGAQHKLPLGGSWTPAVWFFPGLALGESGAGESAFTDLGSATLDGAGVRLLRVARVVPHQSSKMTAEIERLSQTDYYLDPASNLPVALAYTAHPTGIVNDHGERVEIRFSDWRRSGGRAVPYRIERWVDGTRQLVVTVTSVQMNPTLSAGEFQLGSAQ